MNKSKIVVTLFAVIVSIGASLAGAQTSRQEDFYDACIAGKIAQCEAKATLVNTGSTCLCEYGAVNRKQADFYQNNRQQLIQGMVEQDLGTNRNRVEYFLIKAYFEQRQKPVLTSR